MILFVRGAEFGPNVLTEYSTAATSPLQPATCMVVVCESVGRPTNRANSAMMVIDAAAVVGQMATEQGREHGGCIKKGSVRWLLPAGSV